HRAEKRAVGAPAADCVAPPSNIPDILGRRALSSGRLAGLGATLDFHHGLLDEARGGRSKVEAHGFSDPLGCSRSIRYSWRGFNMTRETMPAIRLERLAKRYGRVTALSDVTLDVSPGEIFGF